MQDHAPRLPGEVRPVNHGTYFWFAHKEGLLANDTNIVSPTLSDTRSYIQSHPPQHVGIRDGADQTDLENDKECGFTIVYADEIEDTGYKGVVDAIRERVGDTPVYSEYSCLA